MTLMLTTPVVLRSPGHALERAEGAIGNQQGFVETQRCVHGVGFSELIPAISCGQQVIALGLTLLLMNAANP